MDVMPEKLNHPPVVEAIASFRLSAPLTNVTEWPDAPLGPAFRAPVPIRNAGDRQIGVQFAPASGKAGFARFLDSGFFFHLASPYPGFDTFIEKLSPAFDAYVDWVARYGNARFRQIGTRNINGLTVPAGWRWSDLLQAFAGREIRGDVTHFIAEEEHRLQIKGGLTVTCAAASIFKQEEGKEPLVVLDVSVVSPASLDLGAHDALALLRDLRPIKNALFWDNLTPCAREVLR